MDPPSGNPRHRRPAHHPIVLADPWTEKAARIFEENEYVPLTILDFAYKWYQTYGRGLSTNRAEPGSVYELAAAWRDAGLIFIPRTDTDEWVLVPTQVIKLVEW